MSTSLQPQTATSPSVLPSGELNKTSRHAWFWPTGPTTWHMTSFAKLEIHNILNCSDTGTELQPQKISWNLDMSKRQTDRHADRNTLPTYQRQSNQPLTYLLTNLHITSLIHQYIQKHLRVDNSLDQKYLVLTSCPLPPIDSIWALVLVWRLEGKIIRTALCCVVYNSCAQWYAHTREQFLHFCMFVRFRFIFVCLFRFCLLSVLALVAFVVLCLVSSVLSQVLAGKSVSEMTYFVNSINLTSCWEMP